MLMRFFAYCIVLPFVCLFTAMFPRNTYVYIDKKPRFYFYGNGVVQTKELTVLCNLIDPSLTYKG